MNLDKQIDQLIQEYDTVIKVMDADAQNASADRAYGGLIRAAKGRLQEYLTEKIIRIAWEQAGGTENDLLIDSRKHHIPINMHYVEKRIRDEEIKQHILQNIKDFYYGLSVDKQVYIRGKFVLGIECKSYTENAMLKRILVDFYLLKTLFPNISTYLFQLESQLGGDYSQPGGKIFGSPASHTIMSYFETVDLQIVTFVRGERNINKPIHKFFKPIAREQILYAINLLKNDLKTYLPGK